MGTLYYMHRADTDDLFAFNKLYHYERYYDDDAPRDVETTISATFDDPKPLRAVSATPEEFAQRFLTHRHPDWTLRVARRLYTWAGDAPVRLVSEHHIGETVHADITYEEHEAKITGSAHDDDYEPDGVTYKPGSAW